MTTAVEAGLADNSDAEIIEYASGFGLIVVSLDGDFRSNALRQGTPCLFIRTPEWTARERLASSYDDVVELLEGGEHLVTIPSTGPPFADRGRPGSRRRRG